MYPCTVIILFDSLSPCPPQYSVKAVFPVYCELFLINISYGDLTASVVLVENIQGLGHASCPRQLIVYLGKTDTI